MCHLSQYLSVHVIVVKWLDPLKTLREQGVGEKEVLVLRWVWKTDLYVRDLCGREWCVCVCVRTCVCVCVCACSVLGAVLVCVQ